MRACKRLTVLGFALLCWTGIVPAGDLAPRPFRSGSLTAIAAAREGKPFVLNLWSINCPPCRAELALLAKLAREHPKFDLVLIAADDPADAGEVRAILANRGLGAVESWIFDGADAQRLRYEIDSGWYGELPRSYFYDASHKRIAVSGVLKDDQLSAWVAVIERRETQGATGANHGDDAPLIAPHGEKSGGTDERGDALERPGEPFGPENVNSKKNREIEHDPDDRRGDRGQGRRKL